MSMFPCNLVPRYPCKRPRLDWAQTEEQESGKGWRKKLCVKYSIFLASENETWIFVPL